MSGNDCTNEQIEAARSFLEDFASVSGKECPAKVVMPRDVLIRLLAWYGALRWDACDRGIGTLEIPGALELRKPEYLRSVEAAGKESE